MYSAAENFRKQKAKKNKTTTLREGHAVPSESCVYLKKNSIGALQRLHRAATVKSLQHMSVGFHRTNLLATGRFSTVFQLFFSCVSEVHLLGNT